MHLQTAKLPVVELTVDMTTQTVNLHWLELLVLLAVAKAERLSPDSFMVSSSSFSRKSLPR
jgi:hypothetical protein